MAETSDRKTFSGKTKHSMRTLLFGNSGSGKSTLAKRLARAHALAHLDLDSIVWEPDQIAVPRAPEAVLASLHEFMDANER